MDLSKFGRLLLVGHLIGKGAVAIGLLAVAVAVLNGGLTISIGGSV